MLLDLLISVFVKSILYAFFVLFVVRQAPSVDVVFFFILCHLFRVFILGEFHPRIVVINTAVVLTINVDNFIFICFIVVLIPFKILYDPPTFGPYRRRRVAAKLTFGLIR